MGAPLPLIESDLPTGHKGQRATVLIQLKRAQPLTARQLAVRLGVSLNAARHHLKELEVEGLVSYQREIRGVGAPVFAYRLTASGEELFPRRYCDALTALLGAVVEREGRDAAVALLESYFQVLAGRIRTQLTGVPAAERLRVVAKALSAGGREPMEAKDYGFMYQRGFEDLDGHLWEVVHMDEDGPAAE